MVSEHYPVKRSLGSMVIMHSFNWLKRLAYLAGLVVVMYFAYRYSVHSIIDGSWAVGLVAFWGLTAYITIPRIHRWLTKFYIPEHYAGRSRTGDGLLGDPINIAVYGPARELRRTMLAAGWVETDRGTPKNLWRVAKATMLRQSYPSAPCGNQFLFGMPQTFSFQKEVGGRTNRRHHVRFWKTPDDWWLPGGYRADWLGAVHFDKYLGLGTFNGQIMHRITESLDHERDLLVADMVHASHAKVRTIKHFSSGFSGRGGGGDRIRTDGAMPFVDLRRVRENEESRKKNGEEAARATPTKKRRARDSEQSPDFRSEDRKVL